MAYIFLRVGMSEKHPTTITFVPSFGRINWPPGDHLLLWLETNLFIDVLGEVSFEMALANGQGDLPLSDCASV
jgi:hypothetical protein